MRVGVVILPEHPWPRAQGLWQRAEALGFDHAWTYDHLSWRSLRDDPWHSAVPTLAAAAAVTDTIRLGTLVASPNFRHPVPFARELITLDDLSGGRFTLGIGAGGTGWDATTLGQVPWEPKERADRFEEFVVLSDLLLRQPVTTYEGRYYSAFEARSAPGCVQGPRLPFAIAAAGPRGMRITAEHGQTWVTIGQGDRSGPAPVDGGRHGRRPSRWPVSMPPVTRPAGIRRPSTAWSSPASPWTAASARSTSSRTPSAATRPSGSPTTSSTGPARTRPTRATKPRSRPSSRPASDATIG